MSELKPCPFCGANVDIDKSMVSIVSPSINDVKIVWTISCPDCWASNKRESRYRVNENGTVSEYWEGRKELIEAWNRRAIEPPKEGV